jgi:hypothetical protein
MAGEPAWLEGLSVRATPSPIRITAEPMQKNGTRAMLPYAVRDLKEV